MANICKYHIKVKGAKNACYALFGGMNVLDDKWIEEEHGTDSDYTMVFQGDCKWAVDMYTEPYDNPTEIPIPDGSDAAEEFGNDFRGVTLKDKSKLFHVEVWCNSVDIDDPMGISCEHYLFGEIDHIRYADMPDEIKMEEYEEFGEVGKFGQYGERDEEDILDMLEAGVPIEAVADMTGKSVEELEAIVQANSNEKE